MQEREDEAEKNLEKFPEHHYGLTEEPTLEQLIADWASTHPNTHTPFMIAAGRNITPYQFANEVNSKENTSAKVAIMMIKSLKETNLAAITWYQEQIENNLASELPGGKSTLEQQLEVWAYTHPNPNEPVLFWEKEYTPTDIVDSVKSNDELGERMKLYFEDIDQRFQKSATDFIQRDIEKNLASELPEGKVFDSKLAEVRARYSKKLMGLDGITGIGGREVDPTSEKPQAPAITLYLKSEEFVSKTPYKLEGLKVIKMVIGEVVAH